MSEYSADFNGDGVPDGVDLDIDGDGVSDAIGYDVNSDGQLDTVQITDPTTGEDMYIVDSDQDGQADAVYDADGTLVTDSGVPADTTTDSTDSSTDPSTDGGYPTSGDDGSTSYDDGTTYDSTTADGGTDGGTDASSVSTLTEDQRSAYEAQFWQQQTENGFCAPTSVAMVVSEATGQTIDASEFVARADELGLLYGEPGNWEGMDAAGTEQLLESYGIPAHVETADNAADAWESLKTYANEENRGVIALIDSDEVWYGEDNDSSDFAPDHAVVVTHVDDNYVYLNDPGNPDGQEYKVSRDDFMDAWDDSDHSMVVTDEPTDGNAVVTDGTTDSTTDGVPSPSDDSWDSPGYESDPGTDPADPGADGSTDGITDIPRPADAGSPDAVTPVTPDSGGVSDVTDTSTADVSWTPAGIDDTGSNAGTGWTDEAGDWLSTQYHEHGLVILPIVLSATALVGLAANHTRGHSAPAS